MFLALVLLLGHSATPVASDANVSVQWQAEGASPEVPADALRALGPIQKGERIVVSSAVAQDDGEPSVVFSQDGQVKPVRYRIVPNGPRRWLVAAVMPVAQSKGSPVVTEGIATEPWKVTGTQELRSGVMGKRTGQGFVRMVRPDEKPSGKKTVQMVIVDAALPTDLLRNAYRIQVIGKGGKPLPQTSSTPPTASGDQSLTFEGDFSSTSRVMLQQRPLKWLTPPGH